LIVLKDCRIEQPTNREDHKQPVKYRNCLMSDRNAYQSPASSAGQQTSYRPSYRAEPKPRPKGPAGVRYPGTHYQLYTVALGPMGQWQPPARRRWRQRATLLALLLLVLAAMLALGLRMFDSDVPDDYSARRAPARQPALAAGLVDSGDPFDDLLPASSSSSSSSPATAQPTIVAAPAGTALTMPDTPAQPAALPARTALDKNKGNRPSAPAEPATLRLKAALSVPGTPVESATRPARAIVNAPNTDAPPIAAASDTAVDKAAQPAPAYSRPVASAPPACSAALRAMQLCGEQTR
jgi:hypothetical protein